MTIEGEMKSLELKVLDFTTLLPGPFATMLLADMGADVVRVEAPGRWDMVRSRPPFDDGVAAGHAFLNRNKRSLALDLKKTGSSDVVKRLIQTYDIVIEQFRPGVMDKLGVGYAALAEVNPRLIYCSLTGYGQTGPLRDRAGHDNNYLSLAGVMSHCGRKDAGPVPQGVQVADVGGGSMCSVVGILAAVAHRQQTGRGQYVDVSMYDASILWNAYAAASYLVGGTVPEYENMPLNGGTHYDYYRTRDGRYISVGSLEPKFWEGFCRAIGRPDFIERVDLPGPKMDVLKGEIRAVMASKTYREWVEIFAREDCCVEPVLRLDEALKHPQCEARQMVVDVPKPNGKMQKQVGFPIKFSEIEPTYERIGCALGEHTEQVLSESGFSTAEVASLLDAGVFG
jgi:crotonobetainyl-CoA:carnitine CoA-transferase CaiB-like acyl-CoA transferase